MEALKGDPKRQILIPLRMLSDYFWNDIEDYNLEDMWFQQVRATSHTTSSNRAGLQEKLPGHVISRLGDFNWYARSIDITPLDFFL